MRLAIRWATLFVLLLLSSSGFADYKTEFGAGNALYNKGQYKKAIPHYAAAIQFAPNEPPPYRNLARAYFWMENYAAAAAYYDFYLRVANAKTTDTETIQRERKLAIERAGSSVYVLPPNQKQALTALVQELTSGSAYTDGGGGAWALYKALLRTRYAEPGLSDLRAQLARRLVDEFDASMIPAVGSFTPVLDLDGWRVQAGRLEAARTVAADPALREVINRRSKVVAASNALLTEDYAQAATLCRAAQTENPDLDFLSWFTVAALIQANQDKLALAAINELARKSKGSSPALLEYARVLRAIALQKAGRSDDAAGVFADVLSR